MWKDFLFGCQNLFYIFYRYEFQKFDPLVQAQQSVLPAHRRSQTCFKNIFTL